MILVDVNVLVYAHRRESANHVRYRQWLENVLVSGDLYGISDQGLRSRATITVALWRGNFARWRDASEAHIRMDL